MSEQVNWEAALERSDWYWGDISRDDVNKVMMSTGDGSFLVRDASSKVSGEYTLTLRKANANRLIKICCKNGHFGFSEPFVFRSVVELINHYRSESLAQYNPMLNLKLTHPISKYDYLNLADVDINSIEAVKDKLRAVQMDIHESNDKFDQFNEDYAKNSEIIARERKLLGSYQMMIEIFNTQVNLNAKLESEALPHEVPLMRHQREVMRYKHGEFIKNRDLVDYDIKMKIGYGRLLEKERATLISTILFANKRATCLQRLLDLSLGDTDHEPHKIESTWFIKDIKRTEANQLLQGKPDGTFLIRNSHQTGQYALSISCDGKVFHCLIIKTERGYGFSEPYDIHPNMLSLVMHYSQTSLEEHNDNLPTTLKYPVYASSYNRSSIDLS